ncbi:MAG: Yellowstone Lake virophage 6, partial [Pseudomonadota bacterium]
MPAHINYETTPIIFYKFVCENPEIKSCYVGQTINFQQRKNSHKSRCHKNTSEHYNYKIYQKIRENGGWDKWNMIEINRQICLDKSDAGKIEQQYIEELQANMNMINAGSFNWDEWYLNNKERICENHKNNYKINKIE